MPLTPTTLVDMLEERVRRSPTALAFEHRTGNEWRGVTWADVDVHTRAVAAGFRDLGVQTGDRVAVLAPTGLHWVLAELGAWRAGAVVTTIYPSSTADEVRFVLDDAGCRVAVVSDAGQAAKVESVRGDLDELRHVVTIDGTADGTLTWDELCVRGAARGLAHHDELERIAEALTADDLAALIYTSGTTGHPKGVMLVHDNFVSVCRGIEPHLPVLADDKQYIFLPLSHVYGMVVTLVGMQVGTPSVLDGDVDRIPEGLAETRPTYLPAVPRVFEKIHASVLARAEAAGARRLAIFRWAEDVGRRWSREVLAGRRPPLALAAQRRLADRLVYRRIRDGLGGRLRAFGSGGAPLAPHLAEFFHGIGLPVLEGYGMTELTAVTTSNRLEALRIGTVGLAGDGIDLRIADDGEVLVRGRTVMRGYWRRPDATEQTLVDGWCHTGDIGEIDAQGFVRITDRKKNLIITSGGKNIAPAPIEHALKAACGLLGQAMLHGDRRKYCVAVFALEPEALATFATREGLVGDLEALSRHPAVRSEIAAAVERVNADLPSYETIKAFHVLGHEPSVDNGELTPSLKLRRRVLETRYQAELDALYGL